jgi:hypothetical protein
MEARCCNKLPDSKACARHSLRAVPRVDMKCGDMPRKRTLLTVTINAELAAQYREAYGQAFGRGDDNKLRPLDKFIASFVEDRLAEEIEFARSEAPRDLK